MSEDRDQSALRRLLEEEHDRHFQSDFLALFSDVSHPCPVCKATVGAPCVTVDDRPIEVFGDVHEERAS